LLLRSSILIWRPFGYVKNFPVSSNHLVLSNPQMTEPGYTLYTSTYDTKARLINSKGEEVHSWAFKFNEAWDNQDHVNYIGALDDFYFYLRDFHLYENGDLLLMVSAAGVTPWGLGILKLNKDSEVLWTFTGYPNNAMELGPDNTIYAIEHTIRDETTDSFDVEPLPFLEDSLVLLSDDGELIKRVSLIDLIDNSEYGDFLKQFDYDHAGDPTHSNSIDYVERDEPAVPWLKKGNLVISVRNINAMIVVDPVSEELVYAAPLASRMQHDLDVLDNGNLMVFDNQGSFTNGGYSRVYEFDALTQNIVWQYDPKNSNGNEFESKFWGMQQRLSNDNTLIVNAEYGQIIEVNVNGDILWDYRIPLIHDVDGVGHIATVTTAERIKPNRLQFLNQ